MTFTLKLDKNESKIFKGIITTLSNIIDETYIIVDKNELMMSAMDPSRICLLKFTMKKETFDEYKCDGKYKIGINLDDLDKILRRASPNDSIQISHDPEEAKIKISMTNEEKESRKKTFSLALLDIEYQEIPMDNLEKIEYNIEWIMDYNFFIEAIRDAEIYSEIISIFAHEDNGLTFSTIGQIGEMEYEINEDEFQSSKINEDASSSYSITFIKNILTLGNITEELTISLKEDHPIKMVFKFNDYSNILYFLAPRVEEQEYEDDSDDDMDKF